MTTRKHKTTRCTIIAKRWKMATKRLRRKHDVQLITRQKRRMSAKDLFIFI